MKKFTAHFSFDLHYRRFGIEVTRVKVSVLNLPNGDDFVLFSDTGELSSVSTRSEHIATIIRERLGLDPKQTQWGENHPGFKDRIDMVVYSWNEDLKKYTHPRWKKAPQWMTDYIFGVLDTPVLYSLN